MGCPQQRQALTGVESRVRWHDGEERQGRWVHAGGRQAGVLEGSEFLLVVCWWCKRETVVIRIRKH